MCLSASGPSSCRIRNSPFVYNGSVHVFCSIQATDWLLHQDVSQIPVVLSRANSGSPQPEFPSRFKAQCCIWDGAWLSHLIPTNCMICSSASCQSYFSNQLPHFLYPQLKSSFPSFILIWITVIMLFWYFRVSFLWVKWKTLNIARASDLRMPEIKLPSGRLSH